MTKTVHQWLCELHKDCHFQTIEGKRVGDASKSELKRWIQQRVVMINYTFPAWDEPMNFPVFSLVLFPKGGMKRTTIFHTPNMITMDDKCWSIDGESQ